MILGYQFVILGFVIFFGFSEATPCITAVNPSRVPTEASTKYFKVTLNESVPVGTSKIQCRINPAQGGTTHILNTTAETTEGVLVDGSKKEILCRIAKVVAEGPGNVVVSFDDGKTWLGAAEGSKGDRVSYYTGFDFAVSRRPFIYEEQGELLITLHNALPNIRVGDVVQATAELPAVNAKWKWDPIALEKKFYHPVDETWRLVLPLSFDQLPPNAQIHNDITLTVTLAPGASTRINESIGMGANGGPYLFSKSRRFHRVPVPTNQVVEPVQVDHETNGLRVNGKSWIGQGWYLSGDFEWLADRIENEFKVRNVNMGMPYGLATQPLDVQKDFLDRCAKAGFKVIYPLGTGLNVSINHGGPFNKPTLLEDLVSNISFVKNHPALLGYYICDDCCSNQHDISLQSQVYQLIKAHDPYHLTIGAVNCGNGWMFTDQTPSFLAPETNTSVPLIPLAKQPILQLSLDIVMQENYGITLLGHSGTGEWTKDSGNANSPWKNSVSVGHDGFYRHGMRFEAVFNCPGTFGKTKYADPNFLLSAQWLGLLTASMQMGLTFIYNNATDWKYADQVGFYAQQIQNISSSVQSPFTDINPTVQVVSNVAVRSRAWRSSDQRCSAYVVAVNVDESYDIQTTLKISNEGFDFPINATRMFNSGGSVVIGKDGLLKDSIPAGGTKVFCLN
eukprot:g3502.t1